MFDDLAKDLKSTVALVRKVLTEVKDGDVEDPELQLLGVEVSLTVVENEAVQAGETSANAKKVPLAEWRSFASNAQKCWALLMESKEIVENLKEMAKDRKVAKSKDSEKVKNRERHQENKNVKNFVTHGAAKSLAAIGSRMMHAASSQPPCWKQWRQLARTCEGVGRSDVGLLHCCR